MVGRIKSQNNKSAFRQLICIDTRPLFLYTAIWRPDNKGSLKQEWAYIMCSTCMSFVPGIVFYLIGQKYFVEGIVLTGMKN